MNSVKTFTATGKAAIKKCENKRREKEGFLSRRLFAFSGTSVGKIHKILDTTCQVGLGFHSSFNWKMEIYTCLYVFQGTNINHSIYKCIM